MATQPTPERIDERSTRLNAEFKEYFEKAQKELGKDIDRDAVCCSWLMQKIAAMQLIQEWDIERLQELGNLTLERRAKKSS